MPEDGSAVPKELVPGAAALEPKAPPVTDIWDDPTGKRGGGREADAKGDAKKGKLFHVETPSNTRST